MIGRHRRVIPLRERARHVGLTLGAGAANAAIRRGPAAALTYAGHEAHGPVGAVVGFALGVAGDLVGQRAKQRIWAVRDRPRRNQPPQRAEKLGAEVSGAHRNQNVTDVLKSFNDHWTVPETLSVAQPAFDALRDGIGDVLDPGLAHRDPHRARHAARQTRLDRLRSRLAEPAEQGRETRQVIAPSSLADRALDAVARRTVRTRAAPLRTRGERPLQTPERADGPTLQR